MKKLYMFLLTIIMLTQGIFESCTINSGVQLSNSKDQMYYDACKTPFGKYPETINYTLGKMTGINNSNMPEVDTYENNAYTRYLKKKLNIQNVNMFEELSDNYNNIVTMAILEKKLPDVMVVDNYAYVELLVKNDMIEDLTDAYDKCASDRLKEIYKGYGDEIFNGVTYNGRLMALPETNIDNGPNMLWLRKDWLDELGLKSPKTLGDVGFIVKKFVDNNIGGDDIDKNIGLACAKEITSENGCSYTAQADIIFANYKAFPKQWIKDEEGNVSYGSVLPQAKQGISYMKKLYDDGILDKKFLLRTNNNIKELISNGRCGAFFGLWWSPNNPLMDCLKKDKSARWEPYMISTDKDGSTTFCKQNPSRKYVVVRKGFEHPEIVMKINSCLFDTFDFNEYDTSEIKEYIQKNVDPTARPLVINVDYKNALIKCYENIKSSLESKKNPQDLQLIEYSYYEQVKQYLNDTNNFSVEDWAAYKSRITACSLLVNNDINVKEAFFLDNKTSIISDTWVSLKKFEMESYIKMITGEEPLSYFDKFVEEWYAKGGNLITQEIRKELIN